MTPEQEGARCICSPPYVEGCPIHDPAPEQEGARGDRCPYCGNCPKCCGEGYVYPKGEDGEIDYDAEKVPCDQPHGETAPTESRSISEEARDRLNWRVQAMAEGWCPCQKADTNWPELESDLRALLAAYEQAEAARRNWQDTARARYREAEDQAIRADTAQASEARLRESIQRICDELGEPSDLDYPAPVANAARIARAALRDDQEAR